MASTKRLSLESIRSRPETSNPIPSPVRDLVVKIKGLVRRLLVSRSWRAPSDLACS